MGSSSQPNRHESPSYMKGNLAGSTVKHGSGMITTSTGAGTGQVQITSNTSASRL